VVLGCSLFLEQEFCLSVVQAAAVVAPIASTVRSVVEGYIAKKTIDRDKFETEVKSLLPTPAVLLDAVKSVAHSAKEINSRTQAVLVQGIRSIERIAETATSAEERWKYVEKIMELCHEAREEAKESRAILWWCVRFAGAGTVTVLGIVLFAKNPKAGMAVMSLASRIARVA
jgi:hypothetical protein